MSGAVGVGRGGSVGNPALLARHSLVVTGRTVLHTRFTSPTVKMCFEAHAVSSVTIWRTKGTNPNLSAKYKGSQVLQYLGLREVKYISVGGKITNRGERRRGKKKQMMKNNMHAGQTSLL